MNQSPSKAKELFKNKPEQLSTDAIFANAQRNLYHSTVSLELSRAEQSNLIGTRVSQFCEQQKLLAEKDLRIQELLLEIRSYKDETSLFINELQLAINELLSNNRILETEIADLLKQKSIDTILIAEKDQLIEELTAKSFHGALSIIERIKDESVNESLSEEENVEEKEEDNVIGKEINLVGKEDVLWEVEEKEQEEKESFTKDRLAMLEQKEKLLSLLLQYTSKEIYESEEQPFEFSNQSQEFVISNFIKELKELKELKGLKEENEGLKELNEKQSINIIDLEKVVEQQICERRQILDERNKLRDNLDCLQRGPNSNLNFDELNNKLIKTEEEKKSAEFQLFKLRMNLEEEKNTASLDFRRMVESIGEEETQNNNSPSTIEERAESEEESTRNSVVIGLNLKIDQLQELLYGKDARLIELEDRYKKYTESFRKIFELSIDFNDTFCPFVDNTLAKTGEICDRIEKHLKDKSAVERKVVKFSDSVENLAVNNGVEYFESLLPSTVESSLI